jgi:hypothetical protein
METSQKSIQLLQVGHYPESLHGPADPEQAQNSPGACRAVSLAQGDEARDHQSTIERIPLPTVVPEEPLTMHHQLHGQLDCVDHLEKPIAD